MSAGRRLARALEASAAAAGCAVRVTTSAEQPWASATFVGARHALAVEGGPEAADWLAGLAGAVLRVPGHLVAELLIRTVEGGAEVDALTLEA